jgi:hypothetical protein
MPRRKINTVGDAADLLADVMGKFVRGRTTYTGNDLHALNSAVENFIYAKEMDWTIRQRLKCLARTGVTHEDLDIETHEVVTAIKRNYGLAPKQPAPPRMPGEKPNSYRATEKRMGAQAKAKIFPHENNQVMVAKLKPKPRNLVFKGKRVDG